MNIINEVEAEVEIEMEGRVSFTREQQIATVNGVFMTVDDGSNGQRYRWG